MKTRNYAFFSYSENNRSIKPASVAKMKKSLEAYGFISGRPILCTEKGVIIDGQHRFEAAKDLGIEIVYEIIKGDIDQKMIELNSTQTNWALIDYINSYASQNIDCYRKLLKFQEKYKLGISNNMVVFIKGSQSNTANIRKGAIFNINPDADAIAEFALNCSHVPYYKEHKFIQSLNFVWSKVTKTQLQKIKVNLISVPQLSKASDYIIAYENIINKGKQGSNRIKLN
jgi:hypothetical protein